MCSIVEDGGTAGGDLACAQGGCRACQDALIREHSGVIHALLRRVDHAGVPYAELVQEGRLALWRAVLGFDAQRGVRFVTYAGVAVEHALWTGVRRARQAEVYPAPVPEGNAAWALVSQQAEVRTALFAAVQQLAQRLRAVVTTLYGLDGQVPCSQATLGRAWGLSRERIRQLHAQALVALRDPGLSARLYQLCERDSRAAYLQALRYQRAWQRRGRP